MQQKLFSFADLNRTVKGTLNPTINTRVPKQTCPSQGLNLCRLHGRRALQHRASQLQQTSYTSDNSATLHQVDIIFFRYIKGCESRRQKNSTITRPSFSSSRKPSTISRPSLYSPRKSRRCRSLGPALRENHRRGRVLDRWSQLSEKTIAEDEYSIAGPRLETHQAFLSSVHGARNEDGISTDGP